MSDSFSIYFGDRDGNCTFTKLRNLDIKTYYDFNSKMITPYTEDLNYFNIGDSLWGSNFAIIICYDTLNFIEMAENDWPTYILALLSYFNINCNRKIIIHPNSNNLLIKYNSLQTSHNILFPILSLLNSKYSTIELI
ncbi:hypothetical protein PvNV_067 [Penaeus vannamei nudivirus]|nr:hypothetical protein PvSNPV_067 [Penaeus vannamei nucleopolyhedrovirus]